MDFERGSGAVWPANATNIVVCIALTTPGMAHRKPCFAGSRCRQGSRLENKPSSNGLSRSNHWRLQNTPTGPKPKLTNCQQRNIDEEKWQDQRLLFSSSLVGLPFMVLLVSNCLSCFSAHKACLGSLERRCPVCLACVCGGPHLAQNPKRDVTCRKGPLSVCLHSGVPVPATV